MLVLYIYIYIYIYIYMQEMFLYFDKPRNVFL